jgi:hypothetical protein
MSVLAFVLLCSVFRIGGGTNFLYSLVNSLGATYSWGLSGITEENMRSFYVKRAPSIAF